MKASIRLTSKQLIELLEEKYPGIEIDFVWFYLANTREYWEEKNNRKLDPIYRKDVISFESERETIRIFHDGSFDMGEKK